MDQILTTLANLVSTQFLPIPILGHHFTLVVGKYLQDIFYQLFASRLFLGYLCSRS